MRLGALLLSLVGLLGTAAVVAQETGELLQNPGFDIDENKDNLPDGWTTSSQQIRRQEVQAFSGNYEIVSLPGVYVLATQDITLKPGQLYHLRMRIRGEGGAVGGALIVQGLSRPEREYPIVWNVEVGESYEDYIAAFTAPNPACRLYIYNVSRQGTIYYDYVSLQEGSPDELIVQQLSLPKIDRPLESPPETEHISYGHPLAHGPLKTFIALRSFRHLREAIELAQRLDLDYDVLHMGYEGNEATSETGRRVMKRLAENDYEVYLVAARLSAAAIRTIQKRVERGAGLVVLEGFGQAEKLVALETLTEAPSNHFLRSGVPWEFLPQGFLSALQIGRLGQGRVVRLVFPMESCRVWGLIPVGLKYEDWIGRQWAYWEGWLSLLSKALLWAARGEPQGRPDSARVVYRSARELRFDGPWLRLPPQPVPLDAQGRPLLKVPSTLAAGPVLADVFYQDREGRILDWATEILPSPQQAQIAALALKSPTIIRGEPVELAVNLKAARPVMASVEGRLIDAFGRLVSRQIVPVRLRMGSQKILVRLPLPLPLCVHHKAFVRVLVNNKEQDSRWAPVRVPAMGPWLAAQDFVAMPWGPGGFPLATGVLAEQTRELGINGEFAVNPYVASERGFLTAGYTGSGWAFREEPHSGDVRRHCLNDPAVIEKYTQEAKEAAAAQAPEGPFAVGITDEAFLSYHNMRQELCFCSHCQKRFRQWLQERYPSLEALNAQWGTNYTSWEQVRGAKTEEIRGQENYGRFVDFRTFMTDVWIEACRRVTYAYHEINPAIPMGHTNTFGANPFNGNDYWKLATQTGFGWGQEYSEAIKPSANKAIFDLWRSFVETPEAKASRRLSLSQAHAPQSLSEDKPFFNYGWIGYDRRVVAAHYEPYWLALHNARGVSYYATSAYDPPRGHSWALVYPTGSFTEYSQAVKEALMDLRGGVGKLLMEFERAQPQIGLLWSHPSMLVAWAESTEEVPGDPPERDTSDAYASWFMSAHNFRQHLLELQLDYQYIAAEQILKSDILKEFPLLIMPFTIAASPELVSRLEEYVRQGGVLLGDFRCLRTDEHGKPDATGALARLFGVRRLGAISYEKSQITFQRAAAGIDMSGRQMTVYGKESLALAGATALAAHASGEPAVLLTPQGRGLTIYLNFKLPRYDPLLRMLLGQIVARAGVPRPVRVEAVSGELPPSAWELNTFTRGALKVHAFIRDFRRCEDSDPVIIHFGQKAHIYDIRVRRYRGETDQLHTTLPPGETALFALLPYRVGKMSLRLPRIIKAGSALVGQMQLHSVGAHRLGDHVVHIELLNPQGQRRPCYVFNQLLPDGQGELRMPLALNDPPGQWTVRVRDVLTGTQAEAQFVLQ